LSQANQRDGAISSRPATGHGLSLVPRDAGVLMHADNRRIDRLYGRVERGGQRVPSPRTSRRRKHDSSV
jgi:hypothetical protein